MHNMSFGLPLNMLSVVDSLLIFFDSSVSIKSSLFIPSIFFI